MNVEDELRKRFANALDKFVQPPILFGQKWVRPLAGSEGAYQFVGCSRIAKATGIGPKRVAKKILTHVKLGHLGLAPRVTPSGIITLMPEEKRPTKAEGEGAGKPAPKKAGRPGKKKS